jgi:glycosyltransferase involved in cell wall biosynthesis
MISIIVPFFNEEKHLPRLIDSLANQDNLENVKIVFVDNNSQDNSLNLVEDLLNKKLPGAEILIQPNQGKLHAIQKGLDYLSNQSHADSVAIMDADSYYHTSSWITTNTRLWNDNQGIKKYLYGPFYYFGFDYLPNFQKMYTCYFEVLTQIMAEIGWFGSGQNIVYELSGIAEVFDKMSTLNNLNLNEDDLILSIYLLSQGNRPIYNNELVMTSGRRMIKSPKNFYSWINYGTEFYKHRWENKWQEDYLHIKDIDKSEVNQIFLNRATKLVVRNLLPLAVYNTTGDIVKNLEQKFGKFELEIKDIPNALDLLAGKNNKFENLVDQIAATDYAKRLSKHFAEEMRSLYENINVI